MAMRVARVALAGTGALAVAAASQLDNDSPVVGKIYSSAVKPMLMLLDPETAHRVAVKAASLKILPAQKREDDPVLRTTLWGRTVRNPIGLAAGFDKDAEAIDGLFRVGFGLVEVGSITPLPQPGNPKPRVFRLPEDDAVINRYGFNSSGHEAAENRLAKRATHVPAVGSETKLLGINLGKNKTSTDPTNDYCAGVRMLGRYADYLVVNVSSPNTPGLRDLQKRKVLLDLLLSVRNEVDALPEPRPPLLLKVAPDLNDSECQDIADVSREAKIDGIIVSNTTVARPETLRSAHKAEAGGLSGAPLFEPSTAVLRNLYQRTEGKMTLIGVGGVSSGKDAYEKICNGASAVQLYSALVYEGTPLVSRIKKELASLLAENGFSSVDEAVGSGVPKAQLRSARRWYFLYLL